MQQIPLTLMPRGSSGTIAGVKSREPGLIHKLAALGVLPGLPVSLLQTYPSYLIQVDQTQLALDIGTARCVQVLV